MNKRELMHHSKEELAQAILCMGRIIRHLDDDNKYLDYWTQDCEYIIAIPLVMEEPTIE